MTNTVFRPNDYSKKCITMTKSDFKMMYPPKNKYFFVFLKCIMKCCSFGSILVILKRKKICYVLSTLLHIYLVGVSVKKQLPS